MSPFVARVSAPKITPSFVFKIKNNFFLFFFIILLFMFYLENDTSDGGSGFDGLRQLESTFGSQIRVSFAVLERKTARFFIFY